MFGFSLADWILIALVMAVIFFFVGISDMARKK
jgi:Sec-independent protein translocase protein TatA